MRKVAGAALLHIGAAPLQVVKGSLALSRKKLVLDRGSAVLYVEAPVWLRHFLFLDQNRDVHRYTIFAPAVLRKSANLKGLSVVQQKGWSLL